MKEINIGSDLVSTNGWFYLINGSFQLEECFFDPYSSITVV